MSIHKKAIHHWNCKVYLENWIFDYFLLLCFVKNGYEFLLKIKIKPLGFDTYLISQPKLASLHVCRPMPVHCCKIKTVDVINLIATVYDRST